MDQIPGYVEISAFLSVGHLPMQINNEQNVPLWSHLIKKRKTNKKKVRDHHIKVALIASRSLPGFEQEHEPSWV